ncbi:MAG: ABC transporter permease [Clostridia bacterium]|nr:ABC transporter permease [Clostridia bacterium]
MTGLIKNEIIKTGKSGFIRVALCFILMICILLPVGSYAIRSIEAERVPNDYDSMIADEPSQVGKKYYGTEKEAEKFFADNKIDEYGDWRYDEYYTTLQSLSMHKAVLELKKQGIDEKAVENFFMYEELNAEMTFDEKTATAMSTEDNYKSVFELEDDEVEAKLKEADKMIEQCKNFILTADVKDFYKNKLANRQIDYNTAKTAVTNAEKALSTSPENEKKKYELDMAKAQLDAMELSLWGAKYVFDNNVEYGSWQYKTVVDIINCIADSYTSYVIMPKSEFSKGGEKLAFKSYEDYAEHMEKSKKAVDDTIAITKYSLENNVPLPEEMDDSARLNFIDDVNSVMCLVCILMVAIAGTTMFNEYSSGSIRLLLIRPKSRGKILMSKLLTVVFYGIVSAVAVIAILMALDGTLHSDKDFTVPYLLMKGGKIIEIPTLLFVAEKTAVKLFSSFVIVACVFLISALFNKGGIFAIAAGSGAMCLTYPVMMICAELNINFKGLLTYTVLPYLDLSKYMGNSVANFAYDNFSMINEVFGGESARLQFNPYLGAVIAAFHIALFLGIAFYGFKKKQIKN